MRKSNDLPVEFTLYSSEFNRLYQIIRDALDSVNDPKYYGNYLFQLVAELNIIVTIEDDDIVQQLSLIWIKAIRNYHNSKPDCSIRQYLIRMSVWGIRDWLQKEANVLLSGPITEQEESEEYPFALDLSFLLYGSTYQPLQDLTDYERYLLYLKYVEDKHIIEIAEHLQKDRGIVSKQLTTIYDKLRSHLNENAS